MWEVDKKEGWALKNWCFLTVLLEKTLESPLDCKEIKPILKEINPEYSSEGLMLKQKLQYFGHLMQRANSLEKNLMLGKIEARRRRGWQRTRWLDGITDSMDLSWESSRRWWRTGRPGMLQSMGQKESDTTEWLNDNNELYQVPVGKSLHLCSTEYYLFTDYKVIMITNLDD